MELAWAVRCSLSAMAMISSFTSANASRLKSIMLIFFKKLSTLKGEKNFASITDVVNSL